MAIAGITVVECLIIFTTILLLSLTGTLHRLIHGMDDTLNLNDLEAEGDHAGAVLGFKTKRGEKITVKVASSFISHEQAMLNLTRETGDKDFETVKKEGKGSLEQTA